ncbi:MAG: restriction endonuclease [Aquabacterium sp.]
MSVPTYDKFIEPVLRYLAMQNEAVAAKVVAEAAAKALGLSDQDRQELLPSGTQQIYKNRTGWAHDRLKRAGLSSSPKRGYWRLTEEGKKFCSQHAQPFTSDLVEKLAMGYVNVKLKPASASLDSPLEGAPPTRPDSSATESPDDRLSAALQEIRASAETELLELLATVSPTFFETIVLDLLHKMGYGANRTDLQQVGGSGDAGIDGIISLDKLGLEKVYVQAKRWQGSIGRPELQAFFGALAGQKAKKGIFITTSSYTAQAVDFSKSVEGMVLIDGQRLASLMIDHEIGVTSKAIRVPKIDGDYFEEESA